VRLLQKIDRESQNLGRMLKAAFLDNYFAKRDLVLLELRFHNADIDLKRYFRKKVNIIDLNTKLFNVSLEADKSPAL
jgi:hypothetical protein